MVSEPFRDEVLLLAPALNDTVPLPLPLAPPVTVSHEVLLEAVHAHPEPAVTVTVVLPPVAASDADAGAIVGSHTVGAEIMNVLESALSVLPPGPVAATRPSYTTPGVSEASAEAGKGTLMMPEDGEGLPSGTLRTAVEPPLGYTLRMYPVTSATPSTATS
jgi:hypothetical protein